MAAQTPKPRTIKLPGHRKRSAAAKLLTLCPAAPTSKEPTSHPPVTVVCISDTHNTQPPVPAGDILLHAGDLTERGSFSELQAQISWLAAQPHRHKVAIAGNHDVLLDEQFMAEHPACGYESNAGRTAADLVWGDVMYLAPGEVAELDIDLEDSAEAPSREEKESEQHQLPPHLHPRKEKEELPDSRQCRHRRITIYGQPLTPQYVPSAFQHPRAHDIWTHRLPFTPSTSQTSTSPSPSTCTPTTILLSHGPPYKHLDSAPNSLKHAGDPYLAAEIRRVRPRLVVFGHIHVGAGQEDLVFHGARRAYERVGEGGGWTGGWKGGWADVLWLGVCVLGRWCVPRRWRDEGVTTLVNVSVTTLVNAAVVGPWGSAFGNEVRVVRI
ncbi:MAG: hypothetical protein M1831_006642 [Alyxoria varia]|nr:MAG: hypothetical protein M1831_006642 [Alyxoria varia]